MNLSNLVNNWSDIHLNFFYVRWPTKFKLDKSFFVKIQKLRNRILNVHFCFVNYFLLEYIKLVKGVTSIILHLLVDEGDDVAVDSFILDLTKGQLNLNIFFLLVFIFGIIVLVSSISDIISVILVEDFIKLNGFKLNLDLLLSHLFIKGAKLIFFIFIVGSTLLSCSFFIFVFVLYKLISFCFLL